MRLFFFVVLLTLSYLSIGQNVNSTAADSLHISILNLDSSVNLELHKKLNNEEKLWLEGKQIFLTHVSGSLIQDPILTLNSLDRIIYELERKAKSNSLSNYYLADLYLFKSWLNLQYKRHYKAYRSFVKAKSFHFQSNKFAPNLKLNKKHELIILFVESLLSKNIPIFPNKHEIKIDEMIALQLELVSDQSLSAGAKKEMQLIFSLLNFWLGPEYIPSDEQVSNLVFDGPLELWLGSHIYKKAGNYQKSLEFLSEGYSKGYFTNLNFLYLEYGVGLLNAHQAEGVAFLNRFLHKQQRIEGRAFAQLKLAWWNLIHDDNTNANQYISKVESSSNSTYALDNQARNEVENKSNWLSFLLDARMWFDAGDYMQAKDILIQKAESISDLNTNQQLEYAYRLARSYHLLEDYNKAQKFYQIVIESGYDKEYYYSAYSAYYQATIYKELGEKEKAKQKYKECLNLDSPVYKKSIHHKAKQAIKSL